MSTVFLCHEITLLVVCILVVTWCGASFDVSTQAQLDQVIEQGMKCKHIPGLAVAIVKDGQTVLSKGYGVKDMVTQEPVTSDTLFQIASLTKGFVAALLSNILTLNPNHKMSTRLQKSGTLTDDFRFNSSLLTAYATFEDLLAHRTGVPSNSYLRLAKDFSVDSLVSKLAYLPTVGSFRDSFYYNDLMYGLVAHLIQVLGHDTLQEQIRDTIFRPAGMSRSTFITDVGFDTDDVATPYVLEESNTLQKASTDFIKHWGRNLGSGGIYSSASDMARWMMVMLNGGWDGEGRQVLREGVVEEVFKAASVIPPSSYASAYRRPTVPVTFSGDLYALGWRKGYYREFQMVHHPGSTFGYRAYLTLIPDLKVGVVSLMTGTDVQYRLRTALHEYLLDLALGHTPWINASTICTFPDPWRSAYHHRSNKRDAVLNSEGDEETTQNAEDIYENAWKELNEKQQTARETCRAAPLTPHFDPIAYTGVFHHGAYGDLTVRLNSSLDALELEYGIGLWRLQSLGSHRFQGLWQRDYPTLNMEFLFHSDGQQVLSVKALNFDKSAPPVFFRTSGGLGSGENLIG